MSGLGAHLARHCVAEAVLRDDVVGVDDEDGLADEQGFAERASELDAVARAGKELSLGELHGFVLEALIGEVELAASFELGEMLLQLEEERKAVLHAM